MNFLIFDREENYIGTLKDVLEAKHTEEINGEDVLELSVLEQKIENISDEWGRNLLVGSSKPYTFNRGTSQYDYWIAYRGLERNATYTFSSKVEVLEGNVEEVTIYAYLSSGQSMSTVHVPIVNGRIEGSVSTDGDHDYNFLVYNGRAGSTQGNRIRLSEYKLEKGPVATPWTPAPEDLDIKPQDTIEKGYKLVYKDKYGFWKEFIVKEIEESHTSDGIEKRLFCESSFYETFGDYIEDKRPSGTASHALSVALEPTRWEVGTVDNLGVNATSFYQISAKEAVQKVAETWQGELRYRIEVSGNRITGRYVDLLARRGYDLGKRFTYTKDLISITKTVHRDDVITALYGYGKGQEIIDEEGQPTGGHGRRIDFADINNGKAYVENNDARLVWGRLNPDGTRSHVFGKVEFDDCEDPEQLLQLTTAKLEELSKPLITYEATVIDLKAFGIEHEGVELGDTVAIIDREFKPELRLKARVVKITRDLLEPENTIIVLGNFIPSIADSWVEQEQYINNFREKQGVWDRARIIESDGTINAQFLNNLVDELNQKMNSQGGYVYVSEDGKGLTTYDKPIDQNPTMAIQLLGGAFRIANSKLPNGEFDWRSFGTGAGFTADEFVAGVLRGGKVHFDLTNGTFLIGNSTEDYSLYFDGYSLKIRLGGRPLDDRLDEIEDEIENIELTPGPPGADGRGIISTVVDYQVGTSGTTEPTGSWSSTVPSVDEGKYLWTRTTIKYTSGSDTITYSVAKQGEKGSQGQPGEKGADGVPTYLHVAYATDANGGGFSTTDPSGKSYLGTYTDTNKTDSENWQDYEWVLFKGADGATGQEGPAGVGISSSTVTYAKSSSGTTSPTSGWSSTVPSANAGEFIWTRTDIEFSDGATQTIYSVGKIGDKGDKGDQGPQGVPGKDGKDGSPTYTWIRYADDASGNGISNDPTGKLYIGFAYNKLTPTESTNPSDYKWSLIKGEKGDQGVAGAKGADGQTTYTWIKYSDNADGTVLYDTPKSTTKYIGIATNKTSINESNDKSDYTWSLFKGEKGDKGDKGDQGPQGIQGPKGEDGQSQYVHIRYSANANGSGMTTNPTSTTKYVGIAVTNSPTAPSYTGFTWSKYVGEDGAQGPQGIQGPKGDDGQTTYTWVKYADTPTSGMSDYPDGKKYIGLAFNKTTETESNNYSDYQWSLMPQNIEIGGRNLASKNNIGEWGSGWVEDNYVYTITGPNAGLRIKADVFKTGERYVLTFKAKKISGTVTSLAGHCINYTIHEVIRDGVLQSTNWSSGLGVNPYPDDEEVHDYEIHFTAKDFTASDNNFYIQPNRSHYGLDYVMEIWDLMLEKGDIATDWTPAPEDVDEAISTVDTKYSNKVAEINTTIDSITQRVESTETVVSTINDEVVSLESRVNSAEQQITPNAIVQTVRQSEEYLEDLGAIKDYTDNSLSTYADTVTASLDDLSTKVDKAITTYFSVGVPTLDNYPADEWEDDDEKNTHLGDLYFDEATGYSYRFVLNNGNFGWTQIQDTDITLALAKANQAQDTADGKRRTFISQPTPPYDEGDLWTQGANGELMRCVNARQSGNYVASDWERAVKYTDDTTANANLIAAKSYADTKASEAQTAAQQYAETKAEAERVLAEAYADGIVSAEEQARINDVNARLQEAKTHANTKASEAETAAKAYAELKAQEEVENLEIGGRNLLRNSKERTLTPKNTGNVSDNYNYARLNYPTVDGQTYTISADVEITGGIFSFISVFVNYGNTDPSNRSVPIENGKITRTYVAHDTMDSNSILLYAGESGATRGNGVIFRNIKIEKGTKATDWTPAPEDVDEAISTVDTKYSNKVAEINTSINGITQRVEATETNITTINGTVSSLSTRMDTAEQKITPNAIVQTVRQSTAYQGDLNGKVDSNEIISSINQTAEQIKIQANKIKLEGLVTANSNFKILTNGSIEAKNATISGTITATSGTIGNWIINYYNSGSLMGKGSDGSYFYIAPPNSIYGYLLNVVDSNGEWKTRITKEGVLQAQGAEITGSISSSTISSSTITGGTVRTSSSGDRIQLSDDNMLRAYDNGKERIRLDTISLNFYNSSGTQEGYITAASGHLYFNADHEIRFAKNTAVNGWLQPLFSNTYDIGSSNYRWSNIFLVTNPNVASDIRLKSSIQNIPNGLLGELKEIKPKMYQQGEKWHFGYIAQDVERALYKYALKTVGWDKAKDYVREFEILYKDESYLSLVYAEIAVLKEAEMQARIDELESKVEQLLQ